MGIREEVVYIWNTKRPFTITADIPLACFDRTVLYGSAGYNRQQFLCVRLQVLHRLTCPYAKIVAL